jgi:hypothetical protein
MAHDVQVGFGISTTDSEKKASRAWYHHGQKSRGCWKKKRNGVLQNHIVAWSSPSSVQPNPMNILYRNKSTE